MDPKLAARLKRQQEKEELGEQLQVAEIGSAAQLAPQFDPVLQARWAKQKELPEASAEALDEIGSAAKRERQLDPVLARRWSKMEDGPAEVKEVGSAALVQQNFDPVLAKRWAKQQELQEGGMDWEALEKPSEARSSVNPELAAQFAKQRQREAHEEKRGAAPSGLAMREHIAVNAGARRELVVPWPEAPRPARVRWNAVVLGALDIELEVRAVLRPEAEGGEPSTVTLQRNARGETFVAEFCPGRDRRCMCGATAGEAEPANGKELSHHEFREVDRLVFKFSNAYSWLTAKDVELVMLFE